MGALDDLKRAHEAAQWKKRNEPPTEEERALNMAITAALAEAEASRLDVIHVIEEQKAELARLRIRDSNADDVERQLRAALAAERERAERAEDALDLCDQTRKADTEAIEERAAQAERERDEARRAYAEVAWDATDGDRPLPEDAAIHAAYPTRSGRHDLHDEAMRLVGAKQSKHALVSLVNWLLYRANAAEERAARAEAAFAQVAHDVGICHEADGHNCEPGPVDDVLEAVRRQAHEAGQAYERGVALERAEAALTRLLAACAYVLDGEGCEVDECCEVATWTRGYIEGEPERRLCNEHHADRDAYDFQDPDAAQRIELWAAMRDARKVVEG